MIKFFKRLACRLGIHSFKTQLNLEHVGHNLYLPDGRVMCLWCFKKYPYDYSPNFFAQQALIADLKRMDFNQKLEFADKQIIQSYEPKTSR